MKPALDAGIGSGTMTSPRIFPTNPTMLNQLLYAGTSFLATVSAVPQARKWYSLDKVSRFGNIAGLPGVAVSPTGTYNDIFWQGTSLSQAGGLQNIAIAIPNSPPNCIRRIRRRHSHAKVASHNCQV
jgi:hypothetical protein